MNPTAENNLSENLLPRPRKNDPDLDAEGFLRTEESATDLNRISCLTAPLGVPNLARWFGQIGDWPRRLRHGSPAGELILKLWIEMQLVFRDAKGRGDQYLAGPALKKNLFFGNQHC